MDFKRKIVLAAVGVGTNCSGSGACRFEIDNASSSATVLTIERNGTGNAITANRPIQATQFVGDGSLLTNLPGGGWD